jgi:hypothetical protein
MMSVGRHLGMVLPHLRAADAAVTTGDGPVAFGCNT